jgi:hypothetical protein
MDQNPPVLTRSNITCSSGSKTPCTCTPHPVPRLPDRRLPAKPHAPIRPRRLARKTTPNASTTPPAQRTLAQDHPANIQSLDSGP